MQVYVKIQLVTFSSVWSVWLRCIIRIGSWQNLWIIIIRYQTPWPSHHSTSVHTLMYPLVHWYHEEDTARPMVMTVQWKVTSQGTLLPNMKGVSFAVDTMSQNRRWGKCVWASENRMVFFLCVQETDSKSARQHMQPTCLEMVVIIIANQTCSHCRCRCRCACRYLHVRMLKQAYPWPSFVLRLSHSFCLKLLKSFHPN